MNIDITDEDYQLKMTIFTALHEIFDPELGINIVDLVWEPKWSYDKLTETGKAALGL